MKKSGRTLVEVKDEEGTIRTIDVYSSERYKNADDKEEGEELKKEEENNTNETIKDTLFKELESLFEEFGVELNSVDGVEVNSKIGLSNKNKLKLDKVLKKYSNTELNTIKIIFSNYDVTKKYSSTKKQELLRIILDYLILKIEEKLEVEIIDYKITKVLDDGYVGGIYFRINDSELIKESGIEYFNNKNYSAKDIEWKTQKLENEGDGEYAAFILPQTQFTNIRGYVIGINGKKYYTSPNGDIITTGKTLNDYYNLENGQTIASNKDGVNTNAVPLLIPVAIFVGSFAISAYSSYKCEQEEGWINLSCGIAVGTTVISVTSLGKTAIKTGVTKFATKKGADDIIANGVIKWPKPLPGGSYINGTWFSEHALARMMPIGMQYKDSLGKIIDGRGITPTVVFNVIKTGVKSPGNKPNTLKFVSDDGITVIISDNLKRIITTY